MSDALIDWPRLLTLVAQAQEVPACDRAAWLEGQALTPAMTSELRALLAGRLALVDEGFLETLPPMGPTAGAGAEAGPGVGDHVGPWRLVEEIGDGGMSTVWLAQRADGQVERRVALKLPHAGPGRPLLAQRLLRERNILASLEHPNIARLYDVGVADDGTPWLTMEFVPGRTLLAHADDLRLGVGSRVRLFLQVLHAVQYAHERLVLHRDLKPGNILVDTGGRVKLLDFGIAKDLAIGGGAAPASALTQAAGRAFTPAYASPEQLRGLPLGTASDVYALGVVLHELVCGERPHADSESSAARLEEAILRDEPRAPSRHRVPAAWLAARSTTARAWRRSVSGDLDAILLKSLATTPEGRYGSAEAFASDLARWLAGEPVQARAPGLWRRAGKFVWRHRGSVAIGSGVAAALLAFAGIAAMQGIAARHEAARAVAARDFMVHLFEMTDPDRSSGVELTGRQLLERGRARVQSDLAGQPRLQADLLAGIADAQAGLNDFTGAQRTLDLAGQLYHALGDDAGLADVGLARVDVALNRDQPEAARRILGELEPLRTLLDRPGDRNRRWLQAQGFVALHEGDTEAARRLLLQALAGADLRDAAQAHALLDARLALADLAARAGRADEAETHFRAAAAQVQAGAGASPFDAAKVAVYRAAAGVGAGRYGDVLAWLPASARACDAGLGGSSEICLRLKAQMQRILLKTGDVDRAAALVPELAPMRAMSGSPAQRTEAWMVTARALARAGAIAALPEAMRQLEEVAHDSDAAAVGAVQRLTVIDTLAEIHLLNAEPAIAQRWLAQAATLSAAMPASASAASRERLKSSLLQGLVEEAQGDPAAALRAMAPFCDEARLQASPLPVLDRLFSLNCARPLAETGRTDEAIALVRRAVPVLERGLGATAPTTRAARHLLDELGAGPPAAAGASDPRRWFT